MTRREERARRARRKAKAQRMQFDEDAALAKFVPTPRPTPLARAVQRVLGPPPVDDPVHGHRGNRLSEIQEALGLGTPTYTHGAQPDPDGER